MEENEEIYGNPNDELSLGEIIEVFIDYFNEVKSNWKIILLFIIPITLYLSYVAYKESPQYSANLTFMLNDDSAGDPTGIGGLLGSLGLSGKGKGSSSLAKVLELFESRRIVESTFFKKETIGEKNDYFANHIIDIYTFNGIVKSSGKAQHLLELDSFEFTVLNDTVNLNNKEKAVLSILYSMVAGNPDEGSSGLINSKLDEASGIMRISAKTLSEELTIKLIQSFYDELSNYYIEKSVEKQKKLYDILTEKKDSLESALKYAEYQLADFEDRNRNMVTIKGELKRTELRRQERILTTMYIEVVRNLEKADFALRRKTPFVQVIDSPRTPLFPIKTKVSSNALLGLVIGFGLSVVFLVIRKLIRDALSRNHRKD